MRGTWNSDGNAVLPCAEQGRDGHDVVEWIAAQEWSNNCVTMCGNSFLAATQWFVGAEQPPHLTCLAPWEGFNDLYNDQVRRGGKNLVRSMKILSNVGLWTWESITTNRILALLITFYPYRHSRCWIRERPASRRLERQKFR